MIKWKTEEYGKSGITPVNVVRESADFVHLETMGHPHRQRKVSSWCRYHDSWQEARDHLQREAEDAVKTAKEVLYEWEKHLAEIAAMTKPEGVE